MGQGSCCWAGFGAVAAVSFAFSDLYVFVICVLMNTPGRRGSWGAGACVAPGFVLAWHLVLCLEGTWFNVLVGRV